MDRWSARGDVNPPWARRSVSTPKPKLDIGVRTSRLVKPRSRARRPVRLVRGTPRIVLAAWAAWCAALAAAACTGPPPGNPAPAVMPTTGPLAPGGGSNAFGSCDRLGRRRVVAPAEPVGRMRCAAQQSRAARMGDRGLRPRRVQGGALAFPAEESGSPAAGRAPKIAVPTRTWVAPCAIAISKSAGHAHRQHRQSMPGGAVGEPVEMRRRVALRRGDAHQPGERGAEAARQAAMKASASARATPDFCGSSPIFTCTSRSGGGLPRLRRRRGIGQVRSVERFDDVGDAHGFARLVGLQAADDVQAKVRMGGAQCREFRGGLLHPVLAEDALAGGVGGRDARRRDGSWKPPPA